MPSLHKKYIYLPLLVVFFLSCSAFGQDFDFPLFLKRCAWGTGVGAGIGLLSLGIEDHPYEHWSNVARGASLGLYGGILYGLTAPSEMNRQKDWVVIQPNLLSHSTEMLYVFSF